MALQEPKWGPRQTHTHGPSAHEATKNRHSLSSWELEPNQGPSAARTHGTQAARLVAKRPQQHDPWRRPPGALSLPPAACLSPRAQLPQGTLCSHPHWLSREEKPHPVCAHPRAVPGRATAGTAHLSTSFHLRPFWPGHRVDLRKPSTLQTPRPAIRSGTPHPATLS